MCEFPDGILEPVRAPTNAAPGRVQVQDPALSLSLPDLLNTFFPVYRRVIS
jgi:hypothetical protein